MTTVSETVHLYQHMPHQAVLSPHSLYGLRNFDDLENAHRIFF